MLGLFYSRNGVCLEADTGNGKSLLAVHIIRGHLIQGRRVATNIEIFPEKMGLPDWDTNKQKYEKLIIRLPNKIKAEHIKLLGLGYQGKVINEKRFGLIVFDEMMTFYGKDSWGHPDTVALKNRITQIRHFRWNVMFISQVTSEIAKPLRNFAYFNVSLGKFDLFGLLPSEFYIAVIAKRTRTKTDFRFRSFWFSFFCARAVGLFQSILYRTALSAYDMYDTEQKLEEEVPSQYPYYVLTGEKVSEISEPTETKKKSKKYRLKLSDISLKKLLFSPNAFMLVPIIVIVWLTVWGFRQSYQNFFVGDVAADAGVSNAVQSAGCINTSDFFQLALTYPALNATIESDLLLSIMRDYVPVLNNLVIDGDFTKFDVNWYDAKKLIDSTDSIELEHYGWSSKAFPSVGVFLVRNNIKVFVPFSSTSERFLDSYNPALTACGAPVYKREPMKFKPFFDYHWYTPKPDSQFLSQYLRTYRYSLSSLSFNDSVLSTFTLGFLDGSGTLVSTLSHFQLKVDGYITYVWHSGLVFQYGKQLTFIKVNQQTRQGYINI